MSRICVIGLWHQGTVLAASLAELGHEVRGHADAELAAALAAGRPPVREPGLPELLRRNVEARRLSFGADLRAALAGAEFAFISLDTPVDELDRPVLEPLFDLARAVGAALGDDVTLCVTAQVPVGTTYELAATVEQAAGEYRCRPAYVPEFLRLGTALETFREADRFAVGADDPQVAEAVAALYRPLGRPIVVTDVRSAELAKHAANAFLATSISFANELADIAESVGADWQQAAEILRLDRRIGRDAFLTAGLGYAGGTLGRELRALQRLALEHGQRTTLLDAVVDVNAGRHELVRRRLERELEALDGARVALLGLTYKPGTSTLRRALSLGVARDLGSRGAVMTAYDPLADVGELQGPLPFRFAADVYEAADGADACVVLTEWEGIADLDLGRLAEVMRGVVVLDAAGALGVDAARAAGLRYGRL